MVRLNQVEIQRNRFPFSADLNSVLIFLHSIQMVACTVVFLRPVLSRFQSMIGFQVTHLSRNLSKEYLIDKTSSQIRQYMGHNSLLCYYQNMAQNNKLNIKCLRKNLVVLLLIPRVGRK